MGVPGLRARTTLLGAAAPRDGGDPSVLLGSESAEYRVRYRTGKEVGGLCNAGRDTEVQQGGGPHSESQGEGGSVEKSVTDLSGME